MPYVERAADLGIMKGHANGTFGPEDPITRAQVVQALANFAGADLSGYTGSAFSDVKGEDWYAPAVAWAVEHGIVNGMGDGTFAPDQPILREHLCNVLARYLRSLGYEKSGTPDQFTDDGLISDSGKAHVYFCVSMGIVNGMGDGTFAPQHTATRGQMAKLLVGMYDITTA